MLYSAGRARDAVLGSDSEVVVITLVVFTGPDRLEFVSRQAISSTLVLSADVKNET